MFSHTSFAINLSLKAMISIVKADLETAYEQASYCGFGDYSDYC